jgi:hypothetical protein
LDEVCGGLVQADLCSAFIWSFEGQPASQNGFQVSTSESRWL